MVAFRRYTLAALSSAIIAVMAAGPAHAAAADTPETFGGSGTARVLHLSLFGKDVTLGSADSTVASTLTGPVLSAPMHHITMLRAWLPRSRIKPAPKSIIQRKLKWT